MPFIIGRIVGDGLVNAGIVDEDVDPVVELGERRVPDLAWRFRVREVAGDQLVAAAAGMPADIVPGRFQERISRRPDTAARAGDKDVYGKVVDDPPRKGGGFLRRNASDEFLGL
jgi:hypothetical protein